MTSKAELRRQQILDAAAECFRKSGFHGASMSEIAKSFGMSAGHIYNYFESKEAIIEAMIKRDLDQALERIAKIQGEKDILKAMLGTVDEGVQRRIERSELDTEILAEAARNPKVAARPFKPLTALFATKWLTSSRAFSRGGNRLPVNLAWQQKPPF